MNTRSAAFIAPFVSLHRYMNELLFESTLTDPVITATHDKKTRAHFAHRRYIDTMTGDTAHEIAVNPMTFCDGDGAARKAVAATFVHEMVHQQIEELVGTPKGGGYHCKAWAMAMENVGLMPSHTGKPGGRRTGQFVTHYIMDGGPFAHAFETMPENVFWLPLKVAPEWRHGGASNTSRKTVYGCECTPPRTIYGKPGMQDIVCLLCSSEFIPK